MFPDGSVRKTSPKAEELDAEAAALKLIKPIGLKTPGVRGRIDGSLVTDFIAGTTLEKAWPTLSADDKLSIARDLRSLLDKMRSASLARQSQTEISSCSGGAISIMRPNAVQFLRGGPFPDEQSFNEWIISLIGRRLKTPAVLKDVLLRQFKSGHRIVLSHGDLAPRNIIVKDGRLAGVVDWGNAGWLPEYMECAIFTWSRHLPPDWVDYSREIFSQTYPEELLHWQAMISSLGDY